MIARYCERSGSDSFAWQGPREESRRLPAREAETPADRVWDGGSGKYKDSSRSRPL